MDVIQWVNAMKWGVGPEWLFHEGGKVGRSDATPIKKNSSNMETFWKNIGNIFMEVALLLPSFPTSWNFWSYPSFHCINSMLFSLVMATTTILQA